MLAVRIGDVAVGTCVCPPTICPVSGIVASGSFQYLEGMMPLARMGDVVIFPCGAFVIAGGSFTTIELGLPAAQLGSPCIGGLGLGIVASGSFQHIIM